MRLLDRVEGDLLAEYTGAKLFVFMLLHTTAS